ncbi:MAG: Rdx family protein [Gemmatimonadota bacterium]|nr:MAG: Rdx family protein [Gemmatimonadota bacterium]
MADELRKRYTDIEIELIEGSGGAFELRRDGEVIFSKLGVGRFPETEEVFELLDG